MAVWRQENVNMSTISTTISKEIFLYAILAIGKSGFVKTPLLPILNAVEIVNS